MLEIYNQINSSTQLKKIMDDAGNKWVIETGTNFDFVNKQWLADQYLFDLISADNKSG